MRLVSLREAMQPGSRFLKFSAVAAPMFAIGALLALGLGLTLAWTVPPDARQGEAVRILFVHVPACWAALLAFLIIAATSVAVLIGDHALADIAAEAATVPGAVFTALGLATGAIWGKPMWGAWWVWDGRLTSFLLLLLMYLGLIALRGAFEDRRRSARATAILAVVGALDLPVVIFSVQWWASLHQGPSLLRKGGSAMAPVYLHPLMLMALGYTLVFFWLLTVRMRTAVLERARQVPTEGA
jgi:heme exporter protein C